MGEEEKTNISDSSIENIAQDVTTFTSFQKDYFEQPKAKESVFWVEIERIKPNPFQPRREFNEIALLELADSIKEYGILQPIVVTRKENDLTQGAVEYELLAGERRLRAAKMVGLTQIPVIIRSELTNKLKLEMALVENLQREDLNPIEKAVAFKRLMAEFGLLQREVAAKVGKSREAVANTMRLLTLPQYMQDAVASGIINEGHTRPLLMLADHQNEQKALYDEIVVKNISVREAELISRNVAFERARTFLDPAMKGLQEQVENALGTRVRIEKKGVKGKISIEFFSEEELRSILGKIAPQHSEFL
ncbi:MAG: ParB/RepB/Spo0J family partition protein [Patescibacteria group bacterium]